jgi:hypothetical protein
MSLSRIAVVLAGVVIAACLGGGTAMAGGVGSYQSASGIEAYIGVVPAEITRRHEAGTPEEDMHARVPRGHHQYHLVAAIFESDTDARITDATVAAQISGLGLSGPKKAMARMTVADTVSYGAYFELPGADLYTIVLTIKRATATRPVTLKFTYDHRNP